VWRTAICPACGNASSVGEDALAAKRASCPKDGEFELTPGRVTAPGFESTPTDLVVRADDARRLSIATQKFTVLDAIIAVVMLVTLVSIVVDHPKSLSTGLLFMTTVMSATQRFAPKLRAGTRWLYSDWRLVAVASILRFTTESDGKHTHIVAHLREGGRRRLGARFTPVQADYVRRRLEERLR
jgi:hypothetical protein